MAHIIIANEEAYELARKLAEQHQTSVDDIVTVALREKFDREDGVLSQASREETAPTRRSPEELVAKWMEITAGFGKRVKEPWKSTPHGDLLYDDDGLPR